MNIQGESKEETTIKHKVYDDQLAALKEAEANVEAALANHFSVTNKGTKKGKKSKPNIKAAFLLKFAADLKKNMRATKERLVQERDAVLGIAEDMGIDLLTGTVMRQPVLVNMNHIETRNMLKLHSMEKHIKDEQPKINFRALIRMIE